MFLKSLYEKDNIRPPAEEQPDINAYEYMANLGWLDFYHVPIPSVNRVDKVMLAVSTKDLPPDKFATLANRHASLLHLLTQVIDYLWWTRWPSERTLKSTAQYDRISEQALLILGSLANNDMTLKQVAELHNIPPSTADNHLKVVKESFGVNTTYAAIRRAVNLGLIDFFDE